MQVQLGMLRLFASDIMGPRPGTLKERMRTRNTEMASKEGGGGHVCDWQDSIRFIMDR